MEEVVGAPARAGQALVCDEAPAGLHPSGFDPSRVAEIAGKLTDGQRRCIESARYLDPKAYGLRGFEVEGRSANSLRLRGLANGREIRSFTGRSRRGIVLNEVGIEVRNRLIADTNREGAGHG
jgi:hypothetical protein